MNPVAGVVREAQYSRFGADVLRLLRGRLVNRRKAMILAGMIDEVRPGAHAGHMSSNLASAIVALPVPEKIRTAEEWRQVGARLRKLDPALYEAIFASIVAELVDPDPDMHESYFLT